MKTVLTLYVFLVTASCAIQYLRTLGREPLIVDTVERRESETDQTYQIRYYATVSAQWLFYSILSIPGIYLSLIAFTHLNIPTYFVWVGFVLNYFATILSSVKKKSVKHNSFYAIPIVTLAIQWFALRYV